jgi:hypothetical protein
LDNLYNAFFRMLNTPFTAKDTLVAPGHPALKCRCGRLYSRVHDTSTTDATSIQPKGQPIGEVIAI